MNVKLLEKVKAHILAEPRRFKMSSFVHLKTGEGEKFYDYDAGRNPESEFAQCGTAACIGGWAMILYGKNPKRVYEYQNPSLVAGKCLGLTDQEQRSRLFSFDRWPHKFRQRFQRSSIHNRVKVAAARIEHFIKTKGAE